MKNLWIVLLLLCSSVCQAQAVKAVITGPKQVSVGDLVVLKVDSTAGQPAGVKYRWLLIGSTKTFYVADGGQTCLFACGTSGVYHFFLVAAGSNQNGNIEVDVSEDWALTIGTPGPEPKPDPKPDPKPSPVKQVYAVIVYDDNKIQTPGVSNICRGKTLMDWFVQQKWVGDDGLPTLVRVQTDGPVQDGNPAKRVWIEKSKAAAIADGRPLPLLVWASDESADKPTIEPIKDDESSQVKRFQEIMGGK